MQQSETTFDLNQPAMLNSQQPVPLKYLETRGAAVGQSPTFNGSTVVWATGPGVPSAPDTGVQYNNAGSFFADSMFTRDSVTKETNIGFETYAQGEANDGVSEQVIWRADNPGEVGNAITLVFDGTDDTDTVLAAWNTANPSNTASAIYQSSNFVPTAQTVALDGGGDAAMSLTLDAGGSDLQLIGSQFSNSEKTSLIGLINTTGGTKPFIGAFDIVTGEGVFLGMGTTGYEVSTETLAGDYIRQFLNQSGAGFRFENSSNNTTVFDITDMEVSAVIPSPLGYEYTLLGGGSVGYIQMAATDNSDYTGTIRATHSLNLIKSANTLFGSSNLIQTSSSSVIAYSDGSAGTSQLSLSSNIVTLTDGSGNQLFSADTGTADITIGDINAIAGETFIDISNSNERVQTTVSGVIKNVVGAQKTLTDNTSVDLFEIALPAGGMTGGFFTVTIVATDGTEVQSRAEHVTYASVNKAGSYTSQIIATNDAQAHSAGTLSTSWAITGGTNKITISVTANSSLTVTNMEAYYQLDNNNGHQVTIL